MRGSLTGTGELVRLALRLDRVRLPVWILALTAATLGTAASFGDLYPTAANREAVAASMSTPAGIAMTGPARYLEDYHYGSMMTHQMLGFTVVMVGLMSVLTVIRHTRTEEVTGRAELIRATVVGRHAHLASALAVAAAANLLLAVLLALGMGGMEVEGVDRAGSWLYGAAHAAAGMVFAGVGAVTAQITEHPRGASGMAIGVIGAAYVLRAAGDIGDGTLSWLSPIGWSQATYAYLDDRWWPLLLPVGATVILAGVASALSTRRDLGAGLRAARPGRPAASELLVNPVGLALRLHRGLLMGFSAGMVLLGLSYGSVLGEVENIVGGVELLEDALAETGGASITESFASVIMVVMAIIASVYVVLAALRPNSEEVAGRAEPLLATGLSRPAWLASHLAVTLAGAAIVMGAAGLAFGVAAASTLGDPGLVSELLGASLAYVPALWVAGSLAVALYGLAPQATAVAWVVPLYGFVVGYLGQLLQFPEWLNDLSPFGHVPQVPAAEMTWTPLLALTAVAGALVLAGTAGFRRRDVGAA